MNTIAIITNTIRREAALVEKSLRASLAQPGVEAVILIDQNETPIQLSSDIIDSPKFQVMHAKVPAVSQARNLAVYPNVEWLIFCDDDGYMDHSYVSNFHARVNSTPGVEVICGSIKRTDTGGFYSQRHAIGGDMKRFWNSKLLMGSNFCVKREVFESLGKFDETFGAGARYGSSEETDFAWNAFFHRHPMVYAPELVVFHVPPFAGKPEDEVRKAYRYGFGKGALVSKWLFGEKHPVVLLEMAEMLIYPLVRIVYDLLRLDLQRVRINLATLSGRCAGIFKFEK